MKGLILAGLLFWFLDLQVDWLNDINKYVLVALFLGFFVLAWAMKENFSIILLAFILTVFVSSLITLLVFSDERPFQFSWKVPQAENLPPRLIHIILDEHIGIEGIPSRGVSGEAVKAELNRFYLKNDFRLFRGAYSHYFSTTDSISNLMNFSVSDEANSFIVGKEEPYSLSDNRYFQILSERGYDINILQSTYLHFCTVDSSVYENCLEYNSYSLKALQNLSIPISHKLKVLLHTFFKQSYRYGRFQGMYREIQPKISLPAWTWGLEADKVRPHSVNSLQILDLLWEDIESMPEGNALFVHLLLPHYPYVSYADCSIRNSVLDWTRPVLTEQSNSNTPESWRAHYEQYFQQVQCLYTKLEELFKRMRAAEIYDNTIILLHGDHGSRIAMNEPIIENLKALNDRDILDGFSTLFAMKVPGVEGGSILSTYPLEQLLETVLSTIGVMPVGTRPEPSEPYVYLKSKNQKDLMPIPYPQISEKSLVY